MTDPEKFSLPRIKITDMPIGSSMDVHALRENRAIIEDAFKKRKLDEAPLKKFFELDTIWREKLQQVNAFRSAKNKLSLEISKGGSNFELAELRKKAAEIDKNMEAGEKELKDIAKRRREALLSLPNLVDPLMPLDEQKTVFRYGTPKVLNTRIADFEEQFGGEYIPVKLVKSQYDILKEYDLADEDKGGELAGQRFYYMKNELVLLDSALSMYALLKLYKSGFNPIIPPYMVKRVVEEGATTLGAFEEMIYKIEGEDAYLIPTSEHPIAAYNSNSTLEEKDLPLRYVGFSAAFRKEAGAHGKDMKGIYRNHQFNKVEQYVVCKKDQIENELNGTIKNQTELLNELGLPFRVILLPAWDMDAKAVFHADVEAWFPGQNRYGELGSHANVGTWQAHRLNMKYQQTGTQNKEYVSTIYGTMVPIERTLACVLENGLDDDGVIHVPKVLADICGIDEITPKKK
ncbi:MAG: serine--tRNA ligase [Candidatus Micrarchaeaceae archaeon]